MKGKLNEMFVWSCIGVSTEVFFTSIYDYFTIKNINLLGYSYVWMFPLYSQIPTLFRLIDKLKFKFYKKVSLITIIFMFCEYCYGKILRKIAICPWEKNYKISKYTIDNLVRYDWLPIWYFMSFIYYYRWVKINNKKIS